jgi:hypothetical protein
MVIWVRFEAIAGLGTHAVLAADRGEFFATGVFALLGVLLRVLGMVAMGVALVFFSVRYWARLRARANHAWRPIARSRIASYGKRRGWIFHVVLPVLALALVARWGLLSWLDLQPPLAVRLFVAVVALASFFVGAARAAAAAVAVAVEGRTWASRQLRWILPALAIGDEADRPSGLNAVWVTPATGNAFGAIALGERHGLDVFLKITEDAEVVEDGEVAMPPTQLKRVEHLYTLHGARNDRPLVTRLYDWLQQPTPSLRS